MFEFIQKGDNVRANKDHKTTYHHLVLGKVYTVLDTRNGQILLDTAIMVGGSPSWWNVEDFLLANMPEKWFIHTPTPEISEAVQLWLFEHGYKWRDGTHKVINIHSQYLTNNICGGSYIKVGGCEAELFKERGSVEIKFTFKTKTVITDVKIPIETEAQKELRKLEEQIEALSVQAKKLREKM